MTGPFIGGGVLLGALIATSGFGGLSASAQQLAAAPSSRGSMELKVRRLPDSVELVVVNAGTAPQLQQNTQGSSWQGVLITDSPNGLRRGSQRVALPEAGLQSISLEGSGTQYRLKVVPSPGYPVGRPLVSSDGRDLILSFSAPAQPTLKTFSLDASQPGRVPDPTYVPPLQARAVAPPVGDMAVGTMMLSNPSYLNVSGPPVTMTLKNAPAKDVLMAISRFGGYGFVYVDDQAGGGGADDQAGQRPISIAFRGETFGRAVNSALLAAGLQGKVEGNMILAGPSVLGKSFGAQMSKVYRLNQASATSAADYLANLGATINKTFTTTSVTSDIQSAGTAQVTSASQTSATATTTEIDSYGASQGPLVGLIGTTDSRLGTITLVGDPRVVAIAETYLKQLDLRQRQVALSVKILDVNLENAQEIANSFAYRWGNNFIVNDQGRLLGAFGKDLPPDGDLVEFNNIEAVTENSSSARARSGDVNLSDVNGVRNLATGLAGQGQDSRVRSSDFVGVKQRNPGRLYQDNSFFDFVQATIESRSTKLLASPTLILQENPSLLREGGGGGGGGDEDGGLDAYTVNSPIGRQRANEGVVRVGTNVITNVEISGGSGDNSFRTCELELSTAGLVLGARVEKIDDNGFVTFSLSPSVSAVTDSVDGPPDCSSEIAILSVRRLDTGAVRVRDGQTLILTGVISDVALAEVRKWPILGDLPLVGQFFRASNNGREKRELVIMVSPRIIDDSQGGAYGYGYQPGTSQSRDFLRTGS